MLSKRNKYDFPFLCFQQIIFSQTQKVEIQPCPIILEQYAKLEGCLAKAKKIINVKCYRKNHK